MTTEESLQGETPTRVLATGEIEILRDPGEPLFNRDGSGELSPGLVVAGFEIIAKIASGGGGTVYSACELTSRRPAAVKVLHQWLAGCDEMIARFFQEIRAVKLISHPCMVDVLDLGRLEDGRPFYVMEYVEGCNLLLYLKRHGPLGMQRMLEVVVPLSEALCAAHERGIVHRDVKASNVLASERDGRLSVKLVDFGIAKLSHPSAATLVSDGARRLGTSSTMAPEQIRGGPGDHRTDIYSMGVLVYQLVTGHYPYRSNIPVDVEKMHLYAPVPKPSEVAPVPEALDEVVAKCMAKAPEDRYVGIPELLSALTRAARASGPVSPPTERITFAPSFVPKDATEEEVTCH